MDAGTIRAWAVAAARALDRARDPIDSLNVFPVPDGDTGTNLALTVAEAAEHVGDPGPDATAAQVASAFARGALLGARGNSGVIVSQYLHGFARGLVVDAPDAELLALALHEAQLAARAAVAHPVEGTILTAGSAAAVAAAAAVRDGADSRAAASAAVVGAREALARSPQSLDVLRAAGVVDAGATGLVVLLGALAEVLGEPVTTATSTLRTVAPAARAPGPARTHEAPPVDPWLDDAWPSRTPHPRDDGEFEVMYVVEPRSGADLAPMLSRRLQELGTSVAVVGGRDGWHAHVHTDDPAAAIAAGDLGARSQVVVRRLVPSASADDGLGVVAGTSAPGLVVDLARSGAVVLVHAGRPVTARALRRAVVDTGRPRVVVLPGSREAAAPAREAARSASEVRVEVLDAFEDVRVVVALRADPGGAVRPGDDAGAGPAASDRVAVMRDALARVRTAAVAEPDVAAVVAAARALLDAGGELLTVLCGDDLAAVAPGDGLLDALTRALAQTHPDAEVVVLRAGRPAPAAELAVEEG